MNNYKRLKKKIKRMSWDEFKDFLSNINKYSYYNLDAWLKSESTDPILVGQNGIFLKNLTPYRDDEKVTKEEIPCKILCRKEAMGRRYVEILYVENGEVKRISSPEEYVKEIKGE